MLIIGEKIHILNPTVFEALQKNDLTPIVELAAKQMRAGADALDINLGPGRQTGRFLPDIIRAITEHVEAHFFFSADSPGFTKSIEACSGRATINAATAEPRDLARIMSAAACFDLDLVVLLTRKGKLPHTVDQWCLMAEEVLETAEKNDFPVTKLYIDPVLRTRFDPAAPSLGTMAMEIGPVCQAVKLIRELRECGIRTIAGLSNISLHLPYGSRSPLHCSVLNLLTASGLDAAIINPLDSRLMETVRASMTSSLPSNGKTTGNSGGISEGNRAGHA